MGNCAVLMLTGRPARTDFQFFTQNGCIAGRCIINSFNSYKAIGVANNDKLDEVPIADRLGQNRYLMPVCNYLTKQ